MSLCPDLLIWTAAAAAGTVAALVSLGYAIHDRTALRIALKLRGRDVMLRQLGRGLVVRMRRHADHIVLAEIVRSLVGVIFLGVGLVVIVRPDRDCVFNPLTTALIVAGVLVAINSLHTLYTRRGNGVADDISESEDEEPAVAQQETLLEVRDEARVAAVEAEQAAVTSRVVADQITTLTDRADTSEKRADAAERRENGT